MQPSEIQELLDLKGWSKTDLASALDLSESSVWRWFREDRELRGPASLLMRIWLDEARQESSLGQLNGNGRKKALSR